MSQGLFAAVSGIKSNQAKIDVISDNIANMNTVAFKSSMVNFETVFSKTLGSGSAPTSNIGGTNPKQIGLGVSIGEITRNYNNGSIQTTGRTTDLNIQGDGFFTMSNPDGGVYLSRAGNLSLDGEGNLVNPKGLKVLGTSSVSGGSGSTTPIRVPLELDVTRDPITAATSITNTINSSGTPATEGTFELTLNGVTNSVNTTGLTLNDITTAINALNFGGQSITASIAGGTIQLDNTANPGALTIANGTSNFGSLLGITGNTVAAGATGTSVALRDEGSISITTSTSGSNTVTLSSIAISNSGAIEATYSNGDKITVTGDTSRSLQYTTATGNVLTGSDLTISNDAVLAQELQIQMANVVNPKGLISDGGNMFFVGPNAGSQKFGIGGSNGIGTIDSGSLETSNVDLSSEFADLIISQRGIDANSRTFDAQNQILQRIVNMGR